MADARPWVTEYDLMVGWDQHNELCIPPWPPRLSPMHNHVVIGTMHWLANKSEWSQGEKVFIENRLYCKHFHNIGYLIPHVPLPLPGWVMLLVIIPLSSSKIVLGSFTVHAHNEPAGLHWMTLNCWSGFPKPSGLTIPTRLPTVWVGVSGLDLLLSILYAGADMLLSWQLNKFFDNRLKEPLETVLKMALKKALGETVEKWLEKEVEEAIHQLVIKLSTELVKKISSKYAKDLFKAIGKSVKKTVGDWFGRTNPGMQEKYIRVYEAEAPRTYASFVYAHTVPAGQQALTEVLAEQYPEVAVTSLADSLELTPPYAEFEQAFVENFGEVATRGTRVLLSGDEWEKLLQTSQANDD